MKTTKRHIPSAILQSGDERFSWLKDLRELSIADLIERYAYAEAIVETVREPLVILNGDLRIRTVNKAFLDTFKMKKEDIYGKYIYDLNSGEWNIPELRKLLEEILPKNTLFNDFEVSYDFEKIGRKTMLLNARRIILEENKTELILLAIEDVTIRKDFEQQKDDFIAIASHELRTPLTIASLQRQILQKHLEQTNDTKGLKHFNEATKAMEQLDHLIKDLLNITKIHAADMVLEKELLSLQKVVKEVVDEVQKTTNTHKIIVEGSALNKIFANKSQIEEVITNLLTNAIKYSPQAKKVVVGLKEKKDTIEVSVKDFGIGIDKRSLSRVFDRFYRTPKSKEEKLPGLGLGLYITKRIIEHHKGEIEVSSTLGKGSTFFFRLPTYRKESITDLNQASFKSYGE